MQTLMMVGLVFAGLLLALWVINSNAFYKVLHFGKTKAGNIGRAAERSDAVNQMREAVEASRKQLVSARDAMVRCSALVSNLKSQQAVARRDHDSLEIQIKKALDNGVPQTDQSLLMKADRLSRTKNMLTTLEKQVSAQESDYNLAMSNVKMVQERIVDLERRAENAQVRLDTSTARAEMAEIMSGVGSVDGINSALNNASKFESLVEQQIAENEARVSVNDALSGGDAYQQEASASASDLLAKMAANTSK